MTPLTSKPATCEGCVLYGDGRGFVPDEYIDGAEVMVLAQNPGAEEERQGRPMVGKTGQTMDREFLPLAGLERGVNVCVGNVLRCRWIRAGKRTDDLPGDKMTRDAAVHCMRAHYRPPSTIRLVVAQGALAWKTMGGPGNVSDWRGFLKPGEEK